MKSYTETIYVSSVCDEDDKEIVVNFVVYEPSRGYRNSFGVPEEPDEPGSMEIEDVLKDDISIYDSLTDEQLRDIEEKLNDIFSEEPEEDYGWED